SSSKNWQTPPSPPPMMASHKRSRFGTFYMFIAKVTIIQTQMKPAIALIDIIMEID
ncbi:hypothetical protein TNCV_3334761, partial [Trichonephila clavipes]